LFKKLISVHAGLFLHYRFISCCYCERSITVVVLFFLASSFFLNIPLYDQNVRLIFLSGIECYRLETSNTVYKMVSVRIAIFFSYYKFKITTLLNFRMTPHLKVCHPPRSKSCASNSMSLRHWGDAKITAARYVARQAAAPPPASKQ